MSDTQQSTVPVVAANGRDVVLMAEAKRLIESTTLSQSLIAVRLDISQTTLSSWKRREGWVRPAGAPIAPQFEAAVKARRAAEPTARGPLRKQRLIDRLYRACTRHVHQIETRLKDGVTDDKDARSLGLVAKTLETLVTLERDTGMPTDRPEPLDRDSLNAELARRIKAWADGE
jgi:hypothetical protein